MCLAALTAMDSGRRALVAMHLGREEARRREGLGQERGGGGRQQALWEAWGLPRPALAALPPLAPVAAAKARARRPIRKIASAQGLATEAVAYKESRQIVLAILV